MNYIKRSFYSIFRNPGRSFVIFLIVFSMGSIVAASIATKLTADKLVSNIESKLTYSASLNYNENLRQLNPEIFNNTFYNKELVDKIGQFSGVTSYDYSLTLKASTPYFNQKPILVDFTGEASYRPEMFSFIGTETGHIASFTSGKMSMMQGRMFTDEEISSGALVVMIPENIALYNGINVGDMIQVQNTFYQSDIVDRWSGSVMVDRDSSYVKSVDVEVVGIYVISEGNSGKGSELVDDYQRFYMPNATIRTLDQIGRDFVYEVQSLIGSDKLMIEAKDDLSFDFTFDFKYYSNRPVSLNYISNDEYVMSFDFISTTVGYETGSTTYFLDSETDVSAFQEQVMEASENRLVATSDYNTFQSILSPVRMVSLIATFTQVLSIAALVFVLALVMQMFINHRRHEIGVYMALGERYYRIVIQIFLETICVSMLGLSLSIFSGTWLASNTSSQLVASQLSEYRVLKWVDAPGTTPDVVIENVENQFVVEISMNYMVEYLMIGLGAVTIGSIGPVIYMLRIRVKEILL